jgi:hypothetical protein
MTGVARAAAWSALVFVAASLTSEAFAAVPDAKASTAAAGRKGAPVAAPVASAFASAPTAAVAPIEFTGVLESGKTYVAEVAFDNNALHIWRPIKEVQVPRQHAWTIDWTNLAKFPALKTTATRARPQRFQFRVTGVDVSSGSPMIPWNTIYHCEVLGLEPVAGAPVLGPSGNRRSAKIPR